MHNILIFLLPVSHKVPFRGGEVLQPYTLKEARTESKMYDWSCKNISLYHYNERRKEIVPVIVLNKLNNQVSGELLGNFKRSLVRLWTKIIK